MVFNLAFSHFFSPLAHDLTLFINALSYLMNAMREINLNDF